MTDTGQIPGEGLPENAGTVEQPGVPAPDAYAYLSETTAEDEDLLLPGAQGAWGNEVPPPPPEPVVEAVHEPGPHEMSGRDSGSVDLSAVRHPASAAPRRPLHLGPPIPDTSASPVRSLADRGPAHAPVRQPAPVADHPEHHDAPRAAAPWGPQVQVRSGASAAETVVPAPAPATEPAGAAEAVVARVSTEAAAAAAAQPAAATPFVPADEAAQPQPAEEPDAPVPGPDGTGEAPAVDGGGDTDAQAADAGGDTSGQAVDADGGADRPDAASAEAVEVAVDATVAADAQAVEPAMAAEPAEPVEPMAVETEAGEPSAAAAPLAEAGQVPHSGDAVASGAALAEQDVTAGQETVPVAPDAPAADGGQGAETMEPAVAAPVAQVPQEAGTVTGGEMVAADAADDYAPAQADEAGPGAEGAQEVQGVQDVQGVQEVQAPVEASAAEAAPEALPEDAPAVAEDGAAPEAAPPAEPVAPADAQGVVAPAPESAQDGPGSGDVPEAEEPGPAVEAADAAPAQESAEAVAPAVEAPGVMEAVQVPEAPQVPEETQAPVAAEGAEGVVPTAPVAADAQVSEAAPVPGPAGPAEGVAQVSEPAPVPEAGEPAPAPQEVVPEDAPPSDVPVPGPEGAEPAPVAAAPAESAAAAGHENVPHENTSYENVPYENAPHPHEVQEHGGQQPGGDGDSGRTGQDVGGPRYQQVPPSPEGQHTQPVPPAQGPQSFPPAQPGDAPQPAVDGQAPLAAAPQADPAESAVLTAPAAPADGGAPAPGPVPVPAPREADPELVQNADDLDTRAADQEDQEDSDVSTAAGAEARQSTGPAAPAYDDVEREAVLKVMRERRDIRNGFRGDPIPHEVLLRVLEAAHTAPSVGHSQPWDFVVIRSAETRRAMHELAMRQREAYAKSLPKGRAKQFKELKIEAILDTPVNIVVTADPTRGGRHTLGRHTQPQMAPYSAALAVENLWLAARAEGLGVGWVSFFDEREMVRTLGLPEHLEVIAYLCVGYVDAFPDEPELMQAGWSKRRPLSWVVHEETYGRRALPGEEPHDLLAETVAQIRPLDAKALGEAWERQKRMTKPAGALGMLEIISAQLCGLSRQCPPPIPEPAAVAVFAGDHGVHAQGVTAWPQEVTAQMVANFLGGGAVCNAFATQVGAEVCVVDVGVAADLPATPGLLPRKVRAGTADMTTGPAMTREEAKRAIEVGIETARDLVAAGNKALLTGEMGIANTTASAALISVFTGADPAEVTGRGTGINDETLARKTEVVRRAIELHQPDPADPVGVLAAVGGLEHAAMVGLLLGGASLRTPVILDGVSAGAAALVARAIAPEVLAACIAGHRSAEPGHVAALNKLGLRPLVDLDLRLGEGTGALLALPMVQSTARAMHEVATFDSAGVTEK
ncbi:nicotinate-nucleotide--dimethylbenzimidazole phosphoribosyltransferase [Streptomyces cyaneogriseus subsp. noncyanogenus]|uniref:Nicotinate-nucleotide--dimethylbenzimidazole phosphoribosyltransferase n=1 Tax=Streptomyces cyaneogriseus subsp. noncyanogenus TaxID=477245 RepID=A0A0C5GAL3_9ACTN|nr:nicotinate-nucleotide--dimethylbenzimidazole phosphoribosyltransferase [Streptomyces cyaneogriseus]AJP01166.1 nicotinate-nucleotide--dimethylbenzimidazole phosphoribosyltransferase [Streptomyces cyaneogriseus subsp. noncyanogenus]